LTKNLPFNLTIVAGIRLHSAACGSNENSDQAATIDLSRTKRGKFIPILKKEAGVGPLAVYEKTGREIF